MDKLNSSIWWQKKIKSQAILIFFPFFPFFHILFILFIMNDIKYTKAKLSDSLEYRIVPLPYNDACKHANRADYSYSFYGHDNKFKDSKQLVDARINAFESQFKEFQNTVRFIVIFYK